MEKVIEKIAQGLLRLFFFVVLLFSGGAQKIVGNVFQAAWIEAKFLMLQFWEKGGKLIAEFTLGLFLVAALSGVVGIWWHPWGAVIGLAIVWVWFGLLRWALKIALDAIKGVSAAALEPAVKELTNFFDKADGGLNAEKLRTALITGIEAVSLRPLSWLILVLVLWSIQLILFSGFTATMAIVIILIMVAMHLIGYLSHSKKAEGFAIRMAQIFVTVAIVFFIIATVAKYVPLANNSLKWVRNTQHLGAAKVDLAAEKKGTKSESVENEATKERYRKPFKSSLFVAEAGEAPIIFTTDSDQLESGSRDALVSEIEAKPTVVVIARDAEEVLPEKVMTKLKKFVGIDFSVIQVSSTDTRQYIVPSLCLDWGIKTGADGVLRIDAGADGVNFLKVLPAGAKVRVTCSPSGDGLAGYLFSGGMSEKFPVGKWYKTKDEGHVYVGPDDLHRRRNLEAVWVKCEIK